MKKTLTRGEMLDLWRNIRMAEPLRLDCVVERTDGPDLTAFLEGEMRAWYLHLLDRGDLRYVCPTDVVSTATVSGADLKTVEVSPSARRVLNVEFVGWGAPVAVNASEAEVRAAASNPFSRRPLVAAIGPNRLIVAGAAGTLKSVSALLDPGPDSYIFDDSVISLISNYKNSD